MRRLFNLFRSSDAADGGATYAALVEAARDPAWYTAGGVADDMDGRFAVLASHVALAILRLERGGEEAVHASVHLTEQFIADMDAQMREIGFDTTIGKQVRGLVGALATRVERWRNAIAKEKGWRSASDFSVFRDKPPSDEAALFASERLRLFAEHLDGLSDSDVMRGRIA